MHFSFSKIYFLLYARKLYFLLKMKIKVINYSVELGVEIKLAFIEAFLSFGVKQKQNY